MSVRTDLLLAVSTPDGIAYVVASKVNAILPLLQDQWKPPEDFSGGGAEELVERGYKSEVVLGDDSSFYSTEASGVLAKRLAEVLATKED